MFQPGTVRTSPFAIAPDRRNETTTVQIKPLTRRHPFFIEPGIKFCAIVYRIYMDNWNEKTMSYQNPESFDTSLPSLPTIRCHGVNF